ncbi:MAG: hypothetical protein Q9175_001327 [Cornicularia normoerica]
MPFPLLRLRVKHMTLTSQRRLLSTKTPRQRSAASAPSTSQRSAEEGVFTPPDPQVGGGSGPREPGKGERRWSDVKASQGERRSKLREPIKDDLECSVEEGEAGESGPSGSSEGKGRPLQIGRILIMQTLLKAYAFGLRKEEALAICVLMKKEKKKNVYWA